MFDLKFLDLDRRKPLTGTAAGACVRTLKDHHTPRTADLPFDTHRVFHRNGLNTVLITPILVNGNKITGRIMLTRRPEDGFLKLDQVIIPDIGLIL